MEQSARMATVLRSFDKTDFFDTITVYLVDTFDLRVKSEIQDRDVTFYVPKICSTAPPDAQKYILYRAFDTLFGKKGGNPTHDFVEWVFSRKFITDYRRILAKTNLSFFRITALTPDMRAYKQVDEALKLIPECDKRLRNIVVGVRKVSLDQKMYPVASTSLAGQILALDPCLLEPDIPPVMLRFAIYHEATRMLSSYGGFMKGRGVSQVHLAMIKRFPNYNKVITAYAALGWFFERGALVRGNFRGDRITGGTHDLDNSEGTPVIGLPPCCY